MTGLVHRIPTMLPSALINPVINSVTKGWVKYLQSLGFDPTIVVITSAYTKVNGLFVHLKY